jgi:RNA polymerase sigma factor (sigma-70 family)
MSHDELDTAELVALARNRDQDAWNEIVRRYAGLVWRVTTAHRLDPADAKDVSQNTWFALAEKLPRLRDPERLAGWLATTARRECQRLITVRRREVPTGTWPDSLEDPDYAHWPEPQTLRGSRDRLLWQAFGALPERCRQLLALWVHAPGLSYAELGRALGMPTGSLGPTRGRCLHHLRRQLAVLGLAEGEVG